MVMCIDEGGNMSATTQRDERRRRYAAKQVNCAGESLITLHQVPDHCNNGCDDDDEDKLVSALWISQNSPMCMKLTLLDVDEVKQRRVKGNINQCNSVLPGLSHVELIDRLLSPYFDIQKRDTPGKIEDTDSNRSRFIAEGTETVRCLIQQLLVQRKHTSDPNYLLLQPIQIESIFVKPQLFFKKPVQLRNNVDDILISSLSQQPHSQFHILLGSEEVLSAVAGFTVSRGCLACGYIPTNRNEQWLFEYLHRQLQTNQEALRLLALDGITDTSNLGSMIRTSSALGVHVIIVSNDCCDAWYRRSIRVSMGHIFRVPVVRVSNLSTTLQTLSRTPYNFATYASIVDTSAQITLDNLKAGEVSNRWCCVMGNESTGITANVINACDYTIRIGMELGVDSLSVPIATGILLNGLRERESKITVNV
jgi:tRNA G18 (ribose-2'-O)-methylase SpoU